MRAPAQILALLLLTAQPAFADTVDVVLQAGHEGRPQSCAVLHVRACNLGASNGTASERNWTPLVADAAAAALRRAGLTVKRRPADYTGHDTARVAVFLHFDGSVVRCASGASVGFPATTRRTFVRDWERRYRAVFPFRFAGENITESESRYYGFRKVDGSAQRMLVEFGELTCPAQRAWLAPRLGLLGTELARFISAELAP